MNKKMHMIFVFFLFLQKWGQGDFPCKFTNNFFARKIFWYNLLHQKICVIIKSVAGGGKMNCEKFTRNQSGNILVHCNRSDPNRTYKNQEIHHDRTHWNYNLAPKHEGMTDYEFMKNRCEEFKILKRSNVNWMVSWVITIPADYEGSQEMFFKEAYNFMENKYGRENVISAYVHLDETSPHMHFCFVPVVFDTKKQEYKVNAKVCINRTELLKIHPQMQDYLESKLQTKVNILNGATAEGNKTIEQLKKEEKIKKAAIKELVKNPTEEIKNAVMEQLPEEQKENILNKKELLILLFLIRIYLSFLLMSCIFYQYLANLLQVFLFLSYQYILKYLQTVFLLRLSRCLQFLLFLPLLREYCPDFVQ